MTRALRRTLVVLVAAGALTGLSPALTDTAACRHEDSPNCVWWGPWQGNGHGAVVVNLGDRSYPIG